MHIHMHKKSIFESYHKFNKRVQFANIEFTERLI